MKYIRDNELSYWDKYYSNKNFQINSIPSQFAVFALSEMKDLNISTVIECGVGNGRDSIFFSRHGQNVIALDRSAQSIESLSERIGDNQNIKAFQHDVKDQFPKIVSETLEAKALYARFFLHSLDKISLDMFFKNASKVMNSYDLLFVEYRNKNDSDLPKVTDTHYREFYSSDTILNLAKDNELECSYEVDGIGYAKYKHDDAFVTRQIFIKK